MGVLTKDIDSRPYTGKRTVKGRLRLSEKPSLDVFFGGNPDVVPITGVSRGKVYEVVSIEGFGDGEDVTFIDDNGNLQCLGDFFFEEVG